MDQPPNQNHGPPPRPSSLQNPKARTRQKNSNTSPPKHGTGTHPNSNSNNKSNSNANAQKPLPFLRPRLDSSGSTRNALLPALEHVHVHPSDANANTAIMSKRKKKQSAHNNHNHRLNVNVNSNVNPNANVHQNQNVNQIDDFDFVATTTGNDFGDNFFASISAINQETDKQYFLAQQQNQYQHPQQQNQNQFQQQTQQYWSSTTPAPVHTLPYEQRRIMNNNNSNNNNNYHNYNRQPIPFNNTNANVDAHHGSGTNNTSDKSLISSYNTDGTPDAYFMTHHNTQTTTTAQPTTYTSHTYIASKSNNNPNTTQPLQQPFPNSNHSHTYSYPINFPPTIDVNVNYGSSGNNNIGPAAMKTTKDDSFFYLSNNTLPTYDQNNQNMNLSINILNYSDLDIDPSIHHNTSSSLRYCCSSLYHDLSHHLLTYNNPIIEKFFHDPKDSGFTNLQYTSWAVVIGIFMGILTAYWGNVIEFGVELVWKTIPELLLQYGVFTDLEGYLPLPHYMWICPTIFGGILSYITALCAEHNNPIPGQNEWISSLHLEGIMHYQTFPHIIILSTLGMMSGLSLGPEMPLVLSSGMVGSKLGVLLKKNILACRVLNLTAASAAVAGFFGFPMAGALFVLELPHKMGLQYFEALSPATVSSIIAVLVNRIVTRNDVKGYFDYPFLSKTLPSHVCYIAIFYGVIGSIVGVLYTRISIFLKGWVHDICHVHHDDVHHAQGGHHHHHHPPSQETMDDNMHPIQHEKYDDFVATGEMSPLVLPESYKQRPKQSSPNHGCCHNTVSCLRSIPAWFGISYEPYRAAVAGVISGIIVGVICMFIPHNLFWGEAQLQTLIDKGKTPLPIFGVEDEPTSILTGYGVCLIDHQDEIAALEGFSPECFALIAFTKIVVVGLSLGTGICGGHFWAPLFVGCAASHFFTDTMEVVTKHFGFSNILSIYPCVAVLCIMASTHIVVYRAHLSISLILTLTIGSFKQDNNNSVDVAGDFSAIFPLLVMACFVPVTFTRDTVFYKKQGQRVDLIVIPEAFQRPYHDDADNESYDYSYYGSYQSGDVDDDNNDISDSEPVGSGDTGDGDDDDDLSDSEPIGYTDEDGSKSDNMKAADFKYNSDIDENSIAFENTTKGQIAAYNEGDKPFEPITSSFKDEHQRTINASLSVINDFSQVASDQPQKKLHRRSASSPIPHRHRSKTTSAVPDRVPRMVLPIRKRSESSDRSVSSRGSEKQGPNRSRVNSGSWLIKEKDMQKPLLDQRPSRPSTPVLTSNSRSSTPIPKSHSRKNSYSHSDTSSNQ